MMSEIGREQGHGLSPVLAGALSGVPNGLYLLTIGGVDGPQGMLVSWVTQVGGEPPLMAVALRKNRPILPALREAGLFALSFIPREGEALARSLGRPAAERFQGVELVSGPLGLPILAEGPGALVCRVEESWRPGDHVVLLGRVEEAVWRGGEALCTVSAGYAYLGLK